MRTSQRYVSCRIHEALFFRVQQRFVFFCDNGDNDDDDDDDCNDDEDDNDGTRGDKR